MRLFADDELFKCWVENLTKFDGFEDFEDFENFALRNLEL